MKLLISGVFLAFLIVLTAADVSARPPCGKVWIEGHYNKHGKWIEPHWKKQHWIRGHHNRHGDWIPGHCG